MSIAVIKSVGKYLPQKILTNDDLSKLMDTTDQWIRERSGIEQRHIADDSETTSDLGTYASQDALRRAGYQASDLDLILAATLSPDYYFPGIGVLIQNKLDCRNIPAMDIRGQCSGFAWSLATADAFIRSGMYHRILVVGAELHTRVTEFSDRGRAVSVLFGDGAGACIVESQASEPVTVARGQSGIIDSIAGCDGSGAELLLIRRPGLTPHRRFLDAKDLEEASYLPEMEGRQVFKNAVARMCEVAQQLLERNGITPRDLDLVLPHQANLRINEAVRTKLGMPEEKFFNNIQKYGNTTAATLPLAMSDAVEQGVLRPGMLVMTVAFGSGFTWGANLIRW